MSAYLIVSLLIQAALIAHCIRSGRNFLWIWAIALIPLAGPLAYIVVELLPALLRGETARRARKGMRRAIDPDKELRQASAQAAMSGDVDSRKRLGEQLFDRGQFAQSAQAFAGGLTGIFEHDPTLLMGLARCQFAQGQFAAARASLDRLIEHNPDFKSTEGHLLYARSLEQEGEAERALQEYAVLEGSYPGAEARLRYGLLLKRLGRTEDARRVLKELLDSAQLAPRHYRKAQARWLEWAAREL
ncbi:MAG: tetratricopeptide repeat protein [Proteobacteria bacterium]|nr:tetratricopeptide repeat protein [Pseudomonadota bacterium]